ncbi:Nuclear pore complex protein Nup133-like protein [Gracilaria domingensis]|nr:Nuclear pore complex protein Nup133-like protein [Gracilaria domingensis]
MGSFAHVASADYPPDVEDLVSDQPAGPLSVAAVAGFAVIASASSQALLFGIAAGPELDAVSIPLQPYSQERAPALSVWLPETRSDVVQCIGLAVLTTDGVLRVFRRLSVTSSGVPTCQEIRVLASLIQSSGAEDCVALEVVHVPKAKALFVFGSRNSAAIVSLRAARLEVRPLQQSVQKDRSPMRFGSAFYSAIRSISMGISGRDDSWIRGTGVHEIVTTDYVKDCAVLVRAGGEVEKWGTRGLIWSFNLFDFIPGRDSRNRVESSGITSDGTLVVLVKSWSQITQTRQIVCFDVRHPEIPQHVELQEPIRDIDSQAESPCFMVVSGDTAYLYLEDSHILAWLSVARGVPADGQVRGSTPIEYCTKVLAFVDASHCMPDAATKGGVTACLHPAGVWVASSSVPAPISMDIAEDPRKHDSIRGSETILWRAFLQFKVGQKGASKASLRGLVNSLNGFKLEEALSKVIQVTSRRIVTSDQDSERDPISLLVDTDLEKKKERHAAYLRMLADGELFSQIRPNAPSIAEDRLWDAMSTSSKAVILADNEMLAAAVGLRRFENSLAEVNLGGIESFAPKHIPNAKSITSIRGEIYDSEVLKRVFRLLGEEGRGASSDHSFDLTWLYRHPYEFHHFLPALHQSMKDGLSKLQKDANGSVELEVIEPVSFRADMRRIILLSCEAATSVVQGSLDTREENYELFSSDRDDMDCIENWVCDTRSCREVLWNVAESALFYSQGATPAEKQPILNAATKVVDEYLRSSRSRLARKLYIPREPFMRNNAQKRRRMDLDVETSEWGREVRKALDKLRQYGLNDEAFGLATKYGDFGTMLSLRVNEKDFDGFMEDSLQKFGDEFAFYAFRWLEQRGEIHLLLSGASSASSELEVSRKEMRSERITSLLSEYLRKDREQFSNLSWMHWFSTGNFAEGINSLLKQVHSVSMPEKKGSKASSFSLCSIAKLALQAVEKEDEQCSADQADKLSVMIARLFMISVQDEFSPNHDALMHGADLVRHIIEHSSADSDSLAKRVVEALRVVEVCETMGDLTAAELGDYVWRRCVERQSSLWIPLAQSLSTISDISLREKLTDTALFKAVQESELTASSVLDVIDGGNLVDREIVESGCAEEVNRLVRTTVALATS